MHTRELIEHLLATLDDARLSRSERRGLQATLDERPLAQGEQRVVRAALFDAVAQAMHDPRDRQALRWLEEVLAVLSAEPEAVEAQPSSRAWFGPEAPLAQLVVSQLQGAQRSIDAAMFTVTDDRIAAALLAAHARGVRVRIITDDDKAGDPGSDVWRLQRAGVQVCTDNSPAWMHHKFAVLDGATLLNGSYNWTRAGATENRENFLATSETVLVRAYLEHFERLWAELAPSA